MNIDLTFEAASDANLSSKVGYGVKFSAVSTRGTRGVVVVVSDDPSDRPLGVITDAEDQLGGLVTVRVAGLAPIYTVVGGMAAGSEYSAGASGLALPSDGGWILGVLLPERGNADGGTRPEMLIQIRKLPAAA